MMKAQLQMYEVVHVKPLIAKFSLGDENVTLMVYLIPNVVATDNDKLFR